MSDSDINFHIEVILQNNPDVVRPRGPPVIRPRNNLAIEAPVREPQLRPKAPPILPPPLALPDTTNIGPGPVITSDPQDFLSFQ